MGVLPESRLDQVDFFETRISPWGLNAVAIGLTIAQTGAQSALTGAARNSHENMITARNAARAATAQFYADSDAMRANGADLIKIIKAFASSTDDPNVYTLAQIPAPAAPTPLPPPEIPTDLQSALLNSGSVELTWRGSVSPGGNFTVWRSLTPTPGSGVLGFVQIGLTGIKTFVDDTLPAGTPAATYFVKAHRGQFASDDSEPIFVRFGNEAIAA